MAKVVLTLEERLALVAEESTYFLEHWHCCHRGNMLDHMILVNRYIKKFKKDLPENLSHNINILKTRASGAITPQCTYQICKLIKELI